MERLINALQTPDFALRPTTMMGRVSAVTELALEIEGPLASFQLGARLLVDDHLLAEVTSIKGGRALVQCFMPAHRVCVGSRAVLLSAQASMAVDQNWLGGVVNGLGQPIDGADRSQVFGQQRSLRSQPPPAYLRAALGAQISTGVKALNTFLPCCAGQRLGIFAGSGVGKSTLMGMLAKHTDVDVVVIGLIGERGREVQAFLQDNLGKAGLQKSVVVVATSDETALMRREAARTTLAIAESFRDAGQHVLLLMDNLTRFAHAQREIGLASGEPPTTKGYTPSVFAELPTLLERAGPGLDGQGTITAFFAVLVDGDNLNEPVSDAVRGILDGHIVLSRSLAERGQFPPIDPLLSVSRTQHMALSDEQQDLLLEARRHLSLYRDMEELIRLGAYRHGSDPAVDQALKIVPRIETFLRQKGDDASDIDESFSALECALSLEADASGSEES